MIYFYASIISFSLSLMKLVNWLTENITLIFVIHLSYLFCFSPQPSIAFACFLKKIPRRQYVKLSSPIIWLWLKGNISSAIRYSCLLILHDDNADIFVDSVLILCCSFSSLILSSIFMITFYILSERFHLKLKSLSDAGVVLLTRKDYGFAVPFL